ncbi:hypothetical protein PFLmoz3_02206 [Pseudomonas fluorescens]|uniref:Uncharacterized protein n=1 Tax=Pseudomonas fluorescens TaxID=294 RepID=A0A109LKE8_PSEFL|nr:hypothetical protein PFLmoz3_02206 [Pseudomonas fluorescens]
MVDVGRQQVVSRHLLLSPGDRTVHDEALVQAHQVADKRLLQQVVADGDARRRQAGVVHGVVDEGRVHHDVAVVGQEQVGGAGFQLLDAGIGHAVGRPVNGVVNVVLDLVLQRGHGGDASELAAQFARNHWLEQPAQGACKAREAKVGQDVQKGLVTEQARQHCRDFAVVVRSDGIEFAHHALLLETARVSKRKCQGAVRIRGRPRIAL